MKAYEDEYGYPPNYASGQLYDAVHMAAAAVEKVGHDPVKINKALAGTQYAGVCDFATDKNNAMARSLTLYTYDSSGAKKPLGRVPLTFVPNEELVIVTTTTVARAG